ncbi:MAG: hypothetical protein U0R27_02140 [Candidatus Nanopelagicales bacterium]
MLGDEKVTGVQPTAATGAHSTLDVTGLFVAIGHDPRSELFKGRSTFDDEGYVLVQGRRRSPRRGCVRRGDLVDHTYRRRSPPRAVRAAALDAERYLAGH